MMVVLVAFCLFLSLGRSLRSRLIKYLSSLSVSVSLSMSIHSSIYIPHRVCKLDTCSREGEDKRILFVHSRRRLVCFSFPVCV